MNVTDQYILTHKEGTTEIVNIVYPKIVRFSDCDFVEDILRKAKNKKLSKEQISELLLKEEQYFNSMNYVYVWDLKDFSSKTMRLAPFKYLCKQMNKS